jgi:hypothetical protein
MTTVRALPPARTRTRMTGRAFVPAPQPTHHDPPSAQLTARQPAGVAADLQRAAQQARNEALGQADDEPRPPARPGGRAGHAGHAGRLADRRAAGLRRGPLRDDQHRRQAARARIVAQVSGREAQPGARLFASMITGMLTSCAQEAVDAGVDLRAAAALCESFLYAALRGVDPELIGAA